MRGLLVSQRRPLIRPKCPVGRFAEVDVRGDIFEAIAEDDQNVALAIAIHVARRVHRLVVARRDGLADQVAAPVAGVAMGEVDLDDVLAGTVFVVDVDPAVVGVRGARPGQGERDGQGRKQSSKHHSNSRDGLVRLLI